MFGAPSGDQLPANLSEEGNAALNFVRQRVPEVANANLLSFTSQIVQGTNYSFTFQDYEGVIQVWAKSWENNFLEITLPNGTAISNQWSFLHQISFNLINTLFFTENMQRWCTNHHIFDVYDLSESFSSCCKSNLLVYLWQSISNDQHVDLNKKPYIKIYK